MITKTTKRYMDLYEELYNPKRYEISDFTELDKIYEAASREEQKEIEHRAIQFIKNSLTEEERMRYCQIREPKTFEELYALYRDQNKILIEVKETIEKLNYKIVDLEIELEELKEELNKE